MSTNRSPELTRGIVQRVVQVVVQLVVIAVLLFLPAGRLDWAWAWVYVGIYVLGVCINASFMLRANPELIAERARLTRGTRSWDKTIAAISAPLAFSIYVVAGLDERLHWSAPPLSVHVVGLLVVIGGSAFSSWAMLTNAFFSTTVRIQEDRGQTVVTEGPYRLVRHPGYLGWGLASFGLPLLLGAPWALIPAGLSAITSVVRTALEDRTLQEELPGYADYARRVRYRLLPGIW
jgi:protein-S-isoprenylcysteine O-methyltransferase Ste14